MPHLHDLPRVALAHLPTPLEPAPRLSAALGGPAIWFKRDDCTGLATGGNKTRKLEFLLAEARARGADTVLTFGALQSNHARQTAAACARLGLACELVLGRRVDYQGEAYEHAGNLLLDDLCGARVHRVAPADSAAFAEQLRARLGAAGHRVYVIPAGGSNATGALGYVACAAELVEQAAVRGFTPTAVVHATSSGGTQAGLIAGMARLRAAVPVLGINTYEQDAAAQRRHVLDLANAVLDRLQLPHVDAAAVQIEHAYLGRDYGVPTAAMQDAVRLVARTEGVLLDPVYSGKAMAGLVDLVRQGRFGAGDEVVFLHTGGAAALDAYWPTFAGQAAAAG
jgi:L-cysteate sulfo-lyase